MLIGIISDTHGQVERMAAAVKALSSRGAGFFVHCGDVGSERILDHLAGLRAAFVWGNCDFDRVGLESYAAMLNVQCLGPFGTLEFDGKRIGVMHGDDVKFRQVVLQRQEHDYLLQGHTHTVADERIGRTRLINPGALHRAVRKTAALLDVAADRLEIVGC